MRLPLPKPWTKEAWMHRFGVWFILDPKTCCWVWQRGKHKGYGSLANGRNGSREAHRLSYELLRGPIPPGLTIDHLCRNRACVNPDHMDVVTGVVNTMRGFGFCANKARQTHCKNGHPLSGDNLRLEGPNKRRRCRICVREYGNRYGREHYDPAKRHQKYIDTKERVK